MSCIRLASALPLVLVASVAYANGRPPLTDGISFKPADPHMLYVRTTFGLLISPDDGCTMYWVCEDDVGFGGTFDPIYAVGSDGSILATTYSGLRVSRDNGCSFTTNSTLPANTWIGALDIGPTGEIWAGTAATGSSNGLFVSTDNGNTFTARGAVSPTIWWRSLAIAPSNAMRVYAAGYQVATTPLPDGGTPPPVAHLEQSSDDGMTWTDEPLAGVSYGASPLLMVDAIDPNNPDIVYVVSQAANPPNGDIVYRSTDGGVTLTAVLTTTDTVRGIVVVSSTSVIVATQLGGSFISSDSGMTFSPIASAPQLSCLGLSPDGSLVGCGPNWDPNYMAVARSTDGGTTWSEVWRFVNLYGPETCPAGTSEHDDCALQQWPILQQQFGTSGPACGPFMGQTDVDATASMGGGKKSSSGCCDTRSNAPLGMAWVWAILAWLAWRPRARSRSHT
jgi:hypothetical protein